MRILRYMMALAVVLAALAARAGEPDPRLQFADGLFRRGIFDLALREYMLFMEEHPDGPLADAVWFRSGECYRALGNGVAADRAYARVRGVPPGPWLARAGLRRADLFLEADQAEEAIGLLRGVLAQKPPAEEAAECLFRLGGALEKVKRADEAAAAYAQLAREHPDSVYTPYAHLAEAGVRAARPGEAAQAEALFHQAVARTTDDRVAAEAWYQLGLLHYRNSNHVKSAHAFDQLLTRHAGDMRTAPARLQAAWSFHRAGRHADAVQLADQALAQDGTADRDAWLYLAANGERQLERHAAAADRYDELLRRHGASPYAERAVYERALALFGAGRHAEAAVQARAVSPDHPEADRVLWLLAECAVFLKEDDAAVQHYRMLGERFPQSDLAPEAWYRLGEALKRRGEDWNASAAYRAVHDRYPATPTAPKGLFAAGYAAMKAGRREDAVRDWGLLADAYPDHELAAESLFQKAVAEAQLGRNAQALETYGLLLRRFPRTAHAADARFWRGVLQETSGRYEEAVAELRAALESAPSEDTARLSRMRLGINLFRLERYAEAADLIQSVLDTPLRAEAPPALLEWLAEYRLAAQSPTQALAAASVLAEPAMEAAWRQIGLFLTGEARLAAGESPAARAAYEAAVAVAADTPAAARAWLKIGDLARTAGDSPAAERAYGEAVARAGADEAVRAFGMAGLARTLDARGESGEAVRFYLNVALLYQDPELTPECLFKAASGFRRLGREREADELIEELRRQYPASPWAAQEGEVR